MHHVYARGIEKRDIFLSEEDRMFFLGKLGSNLGRWKMRCYAWALMPNHFHLLLRSDSGLLPSFMRCLMTGYSKYFNERHNRVGHFFQNRYKSPIIGKAEYFREAVRYIHLNPLRSGIVRSIDELDAYFWTGHRKIVRSGSPEWQDTGLVREEFGGSANNDNWLRTYRGFLELAVDAASEGGGFAAAERVSFPGEYEDPVPSHELFIQIVNRICARRGVPVEDALGGNRKYDAVEVRREILKACKERMGVSLSQMAYWLGIKENTASYLLKTNRRAPR